MLIKYVSKEKNHLNTLFDTMTMMSLDHYA